MIKLKRSVQRTPMTKPMQLAKFFGIHSAHVEYETDAWTRSKLQIEPIENIGPDVIVH